MYQTFVEHLQCTRYFSHKGKSKPITPIFEEITIKYRTR